MSYEIKGKIIKRLKERSGQTANGTWISQEYIIETESGQYPKCVCVKFFGEERVNMAKEKLHSNTECTLHVDIDAREYNGNWFNSVSCWKIDLADAPSAAPEPIKESPKVETKQQPTQTPPPANFEDATDDLPF